MLLINPKESSESRGGWQYVDPLLMQYANNWARSTPCELNMEGDLSLLLMIIYFLIQQWFSNALKSYNEIRYINYFHKTLDIL